MCCAPIVYMFVYILIGAHIVPLSNIQLNSIFFDAGKKYEPAPWVPPQPRTPSPAANPSPTKGGKKEKKEKATPEPPPQVNSYTPQLNPNT